MTELERLAAALLAQWHAGGGTGGGPITIAALLDRVLPYRTARRLLGIDVSEDYEALVLRLVAEEERLVTTEPLDAAEMAKATATAKLPDLDVLQLLRAATVTLTPQSVERLHGVLPMPAASEPSEWAPPASPAPLVESPAAPQKVLPLHPAEAVAQPTPSSSAVAEEYLTSVTFAAPAAAMCWSCGDPLPADRAVKFCPYCGADQREPVCPACGVAVERRWKHCAECGTALRSPAG